MKTLTTILVFYFIAQGVISESLTLSQDDSHSESHFTGQGLIDLGTKLDKPILKLIGQTVRRVENRMDKAHLIKIKDVIEEMCRLHPCAEWSEWSKCDAIKFGEFGGQTRQRTCGSNTTFCTYDSKPITVKDTQVCEFECPKGYINTNHGFCLKFYDTEKLARDDAENVCQGDGGHIVNIDSELKVKYVNETILQQSFSSAYIWIDGRKSVQGEKWSYGYIFTSQQIRRSPFGETMTRIMEQTICASCITRHHTLIKSGDGLITHVMINLHLIASYLQSDSE